ncbi:tryptophan--tRNA ligase [Candidatus Peregrinibacteria bacterium]|jgi:tryptophanyl-tRNA synthetase|nr:tryptophan--tRNA ligase [Candidatus Peregrinibacteria bacterium]MBT4632135.1 tryptophan--tRNA ligase [Candidatus Peregrinibacteria bacterium]MBT5517033.1 tryptophan--tRNA ligase [Candidatus Peregrinibacteria bacterium]MBT5824053.1 tryptophan--tRNA ligase [Candidatus Peregrinibacteria bacterium]
MRILSGVKPTGRPHVGNYLGAIRQHIALQEKNNECIYMVADYHALTTLRDADLMREYRRGIALDYLALGLDPEKAIFFFQSDIPMHAELAWILSTITPHGLLERAHAWKDTKAKGNREMNAGLFTYPILMAADILLYNADSVPVGKDQKQHVEIARDIAEKFNNTFGDTFTLPEPDIPEDVATIIGTDGQKMSKSYNNTIGIFEDEATIKKQVMSITTASIELAEPMPIENDIILGLYEQFSSSAELDELKANYKAGGFGYGNAKKALLNKIIEHFAEARERRTKLAESDNIKEIMHEGAKKAQKIAITTMSDVYVKTGLS